MWKSLISKDKHKFEQRTKVGAIVNFFSEQFLNRDFEVLNLIPINHETYIKLYNLKTIFIDFNLIERNHPWKDFAINDIVDQLKKLDVDIYIINNTGFSKIEIDGVTIIDVKAEEEKITYNNNNFILPTLINEKQFNVVEKNLKYDILIVSTDTIAKHQYISKLYEDKGYKVKIMKLDPENRKKMELLMETIKSSKVLHLFSVENFNKLTIDYIEKLATIMGTIVINSNENYYEYSNAFHFHEQNSLMDFLSAILNNKILFDKEILKLRRNVMLKNTFIRYISFANILNYEVSRTNAKVSLFLFMKSSSRLEEYIKDLNNQNYVDLQLIIITNNFKLTDTKINNLNKLYNLDLIFVFKSDDETFGSVFSDNLSKVKYDFICKISDDIKVFKNLILDLWLSSHYSEADIIGKKASFIHILDSDTTVTINQHKQNMYAKSMIPQIFFGKSKFINKILLPYSEESVERHLLKKTIQNNGIVYTNDIYGFYLIYIKNQSIEKNEMTTEDIYEHCNFYSIGKPDQTLLLM